VAKMDANAVVEVAEKAHKGGRVVAADGPAVQDWSGFLIDLRRVSEVLVI